MSSLGAGGRTPLLKTSWRKVDLQGCFKRGWHVDLGSAEFDGNPAIAAVPRGKAEKDG